jgi:hypothetical protein
VSGSASECGYSAQLAEPTWFRSVSSLSEYSSCCSVSSTQIPAASTDWTAVRCHPDCQVSIILITLEHRFEQLDQVVHSRGTVITAVSVHRHSFTSPLSGARNVGAGEGPPVPGPSASVDDRLFSEALKVIIYSEGCRGHTVLQSQQRATGVDYLPADRCT